MEQRDGSSVPPLLHCIQMIYCSWVMSMPRKARLKSRSNIYHVMLRGINRQTIFEDNGDRHYFLTVLKTCKELSGFKLYAFCLMSNHIHLLIETGDEPLVQIFKRIGGRYVGWYNHKYERVGHLFQDRFRSENVETDQYFMTVLRYILQNPMKAGMEDHPGTYRWSSFLAYEKGAGSITDTQYAFDLFHSKSSLMEYLQQTGDDAVMDEPDYRWRIKDDVAKQIMTRISQCTCISDYQKLESSVQKQYAAEMYLENLTMGQISRLTGMSKTTISRVVKKIDPQSLSERQQLYLRESGPSSFQPEYNEIW